VIDRRLPLREESHPRSIGAAWRPWAIAVGVGVTAVGALALHLMGRRLWCACGSPRPWSWDIWSSHNSQHFVDPYTFTHALHGMFYYLLLWLVFRGRRPSLRALLALIVEVAWEVGENTNTVIEAYRASTISLNYYGDSIANSLGDVAAFALGYLAALRLPVWVAVASFVAVEIVLLLTIRDSLVLNVLMLLHPVEAIKAWQLSGRALPV